MVKEAELHRSEDQERRRQVEDVLSAQRRQGEGYRLVTGIEYQQQRIANDGVSAIVHLIRGGAVDQHAHYLAAGIPVVPLHLRAIRLHPGDVLVLGAGHGNTAEEMATSQHGVRL